MFGVSCWFKLTCQVVCYKVVPGRMGQRGNVQGMKPSKTMRSVFALNFMWPRLEDVQSNDRRAQENASSGTRRGAGYREVRVPGEGL